VTAVEVIDPRTDQRWAELAATHGTVFHSPAWSRVVADAFGVEVRAAILIDDGVVRSGLVAANIDDAIGRRTATLPFSDFCEPLGVSSLADWQLLTDALVDPDVPYSLRLRRHPVVAEDARLREGATFGWHEIDLSGTEDDAWNRLASGARQNIRHARAHSVTVEHRSDRDAVTEFHRLHAELRRTKYSMLAQPPAFFDALFQHFSPDDLNVVFAHHDGMAVAASFLLRCGTTAYYKFNTSRPEANTPRANDLAMWGAMTFARDQWGCTALDLGLSALDQPGLLRYKQKYATSRGELVAYSIGAGDARAAATRGLINEMTALMMDERIPHDVRDRASDVMYRHFS
jgi:Acetyltransferase (GNAT) domain